jgi:hypothetical protein
MTVKSFAKGAAPMLSKILTFAILTAATYALSDGLQGDWRGTSACQQKNTACHDEQVVYHIPAPDSNGKVTVNADRIVDGKAIDMGPVEMTYDKAKQTLSGEDGPRVWHFDIKGKTMSGTLISSGTLVRKVDLKKD